MDRKERARERKAAMRDAAGVPPGMTWRDHKLFNQSRLLPLDKKLAANKFEADIKEHGLTEAMRLHDITE